MRKFTVLEKIAYIAGCLLVSYAARAGETRLITDMPTSNKTTAGDAAKSKKPAYECQKVKMGQHGNPINVPGSKSSWFIDVAESTDAAAEAIADGKTAVRCKLKVFDLSKGRMATADL